MNRRTGRWILFALGLLSALYVTYMGRKDSMPPAEVREIKGYQAWEQQTLDLAETLPVQDGGRVKPLATYAGFTMLRLYGGRSMEVIDKDGKKVELKPLAWMMDVLFRPHLAVELPTFRVDNPKVLESAGIKTEGGLDRYSYTQLEPGLDKLVELAQSYEKIEQKLRKIEEQQTIDLAYNVHTFRGLISYFAFARNGVRMAATGNTGAPSTADVSTVMQTAPVIVDVLRQSQAQGKEIPAHVKALLEEVLAGANGSKFFLLIYPPADTSDENWLSAGDRIMNMMMTNTREPEQSVKDIKAAETMARSVATGEPAFRTALTSFKDSIVSRAKNRGEYRFVELEADYFRKDWFINALVCFLIAVVTVGVMFFAGRTKGGNIAALLTTGLTALGLVFLVIPIVKRCIIMQRPPIGNLYDTIIFIALAFVALALVVEWLTRKRFAIAAAPFVGAFLIVLARRFEVGDAKDHLDPLVAVLDSNYWLTTHVITIALGYAAGLITAFLAIIYVLVRALKLDEDEQGNIDKSLRRSLTRSVYGCVCLTLLFSLVGTVLGGVWANESWGRFWGWDPKENGALMIVIWSLVILHARLGGFFNEWGFHMAGVFTAVVVCFSWWHVNFLGVGLHNYGFTADKIGSVYRVYAVMSGIIALGGIAWLFESFGGKKPGVEDSDSVPGRMAQGEAS